MVRNLKLGTRVMVILEVCTVVLVAALLFVVLSEINKFNRNSSISHARNSVMALESKIESSEEDALRFAQTTAANTHLIQSIALADMQTLTQLLSAAATNAKADFILLTDRSGALLGSTVTEYNLSSAAVQDGLKTALLGETYTTLESDIVSRLSAVSIAPILENKAVIGTVIVGFAVDHEGIVDAIKEDQEDDVTIFLGDTRVNTTIEQNGKRVIGTAMDGKVADKILNNRETYSGDLVIAGTPYVTYYKPLENPQGKVIGALFAGKSQKEILAVTSNLIYLSIAIALAGVVLLSLVVYFYTKKVISLPLKKLVAVSKQIADGNLNVRIDIPAQKDEIGELANAFQLMSSNLNEVIGSINTGAEQVAEGAKQVAASSEALAQGATQQASAIEEFSSSIEQISSQATQNAEHANRANALSRAAWEKAEEGDKQMTLMLAAMTRIDQASEDIAKIIKAIDDIAFQTNILALNAAVEAARAGQHGKGFAVVAEEVRNLASRSAEAAKQTTSSIEQSIKEVENGTKITATTASMLKAIVDGVSQSAALVGEIAEASSQQVTGIEQINQGISQITSVMQSNSATSQENSAASEELLGQAEFMKKQAGHFTLHG